MAGPNHFGDNRLFRLLNSRLVFFLSSARHCRSDPSDTRPAHFPDIAVAVRYADYVAGRDPAMEVVLNYVPKGLPTVDSAGISLRPLVGRYQWSFERALEISVSGERGRATVTDYFQTPLYPMSATHFVTDIPGMEFRPVKDGQGSITGVLCKTRGYQKLLRRLPTSVRTPFELLQAGEYDAAVEAYRTFHGRHPDDDLVSEGRLNGLGYQFLRNTRVKEALAVFRINTQLYPNSSNAFDSLAEAFEAIGDISSAIDNYRKAAKLDSGNTHARKKLAKLGVRQLVLAPKNPRTKPVPTLALSSLCSPALRRCRNETLCADEAHAVGNCRGRHANIAHRICSQRVRTFALHSPRECLGLRPGRLEQRRL
jgi:hypothetical protein